MKFITVTELRPRLLEIVSEIEATKEQFVVTKNGKPVVLIQFVTDEAFAGLKASTSEAKATIAGGITYDKTPAVPAPPPEPEPKKDEMDKLYSPKKAESSEGKGGKGHGKK
ncbi:MAG: type II toxin-antitoxin system Phd/YefM family antitoxin [Syntrophorhabdales bacterium]|jgi:prevent-host-death family protein